MKRRIGVLLLLSLVLVMTGIVSADRSLYEVTEPITIEWWHSLEDQYAPYIQEMVDMFHEANPLITVKPIYVGSYTELHTQLIAAVAAGEVPAISNAQSPYVAAYGEAGICEPLDPYIEAFGFDINDFGEGLVATTSYNGKQIAVPFLISTQTMFYNKTAAEQEGIEMPKRFDDLEEFLQKATIFNEEGVRTFFWT